MIRNWKKPTEASIARALELLDRAGGDRPPDPGDELPEGYQLIRAGAKTK